MRATFVIDYQNLHLTARDLFCPGADAHEALLAPMAFARAALEIRNRGQGEGYPDAVLGRVLVYRGLPHVDHQKDQHRRCQLQAKQWRQAGAEVHLRDLKYRPRYAASGSVVRDVNGRVVMDPTSGREKGIDVLCALACVREARAHDTDLVILASRDTDLVPALDEVADLRGRETGIAKIETVAWHERAAGERNPGCLRPTKPRRLWNTNLGRRVYEASLDANDYR